MEVILNKKVLIVDDDERMLRALAKTLSSQGAIVVTTQSAGDAMGIINRHKGTDLVITDLRMPQITGTALLGFIRMLSPHLPVIVLTAFGSDEMRTECLRQGAAAFLEKNLSTMQLLAEIEHVLTLWDRERPGSKMIPENGVGG